MCKLNFFNYKISDKEFKKFTYSSISSLIISETTKVTSALQSFIQSLQGVLPILIIFIVFYKTDPYYTILSIIFIIFYLFLFYFIVKKKIKFYSFKKFFSEQKSNSKLIDLFTNFIYYKINGKLRDSLFKDINKQLKVKLNIYTKFSLIENFPNASVEFIIYSLLASIIFFTSGNKFDFEYVSLENIGVFIFGLLRLSKFFSLFLANYLMFRSNEKTLLTISNLLFNKLQNINYNKNYKININRITKIKINDLILSYKNRRNKILYNNFVFKIGKINLIVGKSGSGKTTLVEFLLGIKDANLNNGKVLINNCNLSEINKELLWNKISYIPANSYVPKIKFINLIKIINKNISIAKILKLLKFCELNKLINKNNLYKFTIDNKKNISTGQSFRISLFLELLKNTDVIIFDESLSSLDSKTKNHILKKIQKIARSKIIIIITHDEKLISSNYGKFKLNLNNDN